jgi:hypothetical protein
VQLTHRTFLSLALVLFSPVLISATSRRADFNGRLLAAHNSARAAIGIPSLTWSKTLAQDAQRWANNLAASGRFEHSPDEPGQEPQGENLWAGTPRAFSPETMVRLWTSEKGDFRNGVFPNNSRSGDVERVGHYTQLIWRKTRQVGCAAAIGKREEFLVCRYKEAGNIYGERPV